MPLMTLLRPLLAALLALLCGLVQAQTPAAPGSESQRLKALLDDHWERTAQMYPEWATWRGDHRFGDRLTDASPAGRAAQDQQAERWLAQARAIRPEGLSRTERVTLELFIDALSEDLEFKRFTGYRYMSLRSLWGWQGSFAGLMQNTPMTSSERAQQLLARMAAFPLRTEQEMAALRRSAQAGWVPAQDVLVRVLQQIDGQLVEADKGPFWVPFTRLPPAMPAAEKEALQQQGRRAITEQVLPALRTLRAFIVSELQPKAPASGALRDYPNGREVYAALVRRQTTTSLSPAQIHAIGQRELARLRGEMEVLMKGTGFSGSFAEFISFLNTDPRFFHKSGEALLTGYRDIAKRFDAEMPKLFAELPRAPYGIVPMPAHLGNAAEYYSGPPLDGSRAGTFFANTVAFRQRPIWGMETLVAHEAVPGHHLQSARAIELKDLPPFRRNAGYVAYSEGWGLYAETLADELKLWSDEYSRFGYLQWQAFRAARLVVDTGLHDLGWSRQQAIDFMTERTGVDRPFVESEVDRYTSLPAQALAYMIGQLEIQRLREKARAQLGARFDLRQFHNVLLDQGSVPLGTLARMVDEWIEQTQAQAPKERTGALVPQPVGRRTAK